MAATPSAYIPKRKRLTHDANETNDELSSNIVSYDVYIGRWAQDGSVLPSQNPRHVVENLRNDNIMRSSTLGLARRAFLCSASATWCRCLRYVSDSSQGYRTPRSCVWCTVAYIFASVSKNEPAQKKKDSFHLEACCCMILRQWVNSQRILSAVRGSLVTQTSKCWSEENVAVVKFATSSN